MTIDSHYVNMLDRFSTSLEKMERGACLPPSIQQAARHLIKWDAAVRIIDFSSLNDVEVDLLDILAQCVDEQFENLKKTGAFARHQDCLSSVKAAIRCVKKRVPDILIEKNEREKRSLLDAIGLDFSPEERTYQFRSLPKHASDRYFLLDFLQKNAANVPEGLLANLDQLPDLTEEELLRVGCYLDDHEHRVAFSAHFEIEPEKIEEARGQFRRTLKEVRSRSDMGLCFGYTLSLLSPAVSTRADLFPTARFIQASYELEMDLLPTPTIHLGMQLLREHLRCPALLIKATEIMGCESSQKFWETFSERTFATAFLVGKLARVVSEELLQDLDDYLDDLDAKKTIKHDLLIKRMEGEDPTEQAAIASNLADVESSIERITALKNNCETEFNFIFRHLQASAKPSSEEIPQRIAKRILKIEKQAPAFQKAPFEKLISLLKSRLATLDSCELELQLGREGEDSHSIYISAHPPSFCDCNEVDPLTGTPLLKQFVTVEEMLYSLQSALLNYNDFFWETFTLTPYTKIE